MKKAMLQNALQGPEVFANDMEWERYNIVQGNGPLDYESYTDLVEKLAARFDGPKNATPNRTIKNHRVDLLKKTRADQMMMTMGILDLSLLMQHLQIYKQDSATCHSQRSLAINVM